MLSSIGRAAIRRVGTGQPSVSTNRVYQSVWHFQRDNASNTPGKASLRTQFALSMRRSYATTAKTTRASSTRAKKPTTAKAGKRKTAAARKVVKKTVVKKAKKKIAAKPKPKAKPKKILTPEEKGKAELKALKATALIPPTNKPHTAWTVMLKEYANDDSSPVKGVATFSKAAAIKYKSLSPEELEQYNHKANQNKLTNNIALKEWTESHTPEEIRLANNARLLLKRKTGKSHSYPLIQDSRIPKRNTSSFFLFAADRWASGDFKGLKVVEATLLLRKEYQSLSDVDRKVYEDRAGADKQRYLQEFKTVFRRDPGRAKKPIPA